MEKKVVYIAGPISGVDEYYKAFERAEDDLTALGYIPLSPARLPEGMSPRRYMRICFAMIDAADAVLFLEGSERSDGALLEARYCKYTGKPAVELRTRMDLQRLPHDIMMAWLRYDLGEVLK